MSLKETILKCIENLLNEDEDEEKCGIFFKIEKDKDPMDIIGVLDFMKYKIENWGNSNIFSYLGDLFNHDTILVIGSGDTAEAKNIIKYVYLSQIIKTGENLDYLTNKFEDCRTLENYLNKEIMDKTKIGYPADPKLETGLKNHLKALLLSKSSENSN
ncbi:MAG: hypothetical protein ACW96X_00235 [Promethearchaeota archaeon]|jgi:hypothetical protein